MPEIRPELEFSDRPVGSVPDDTDQVIDAVPAKLGVCENAVPWFIASSDVVLMVGADPDTDPVNALSLYPAELVARMVKE